MKYDNEVCMKTTYKTPETSAEEERLRKERLDREAVKLIRRHGDTALESVGALYVQRLRIEN